jgi:hypothetical protein
VTVARKLRGESFRVAPFQGAGELRRPVPELSGRRGHRVVFQLLHSSKLPLLMSPTYRRHFCLDPRHHFPNHRRMSTLVLNKARARNAANQGSAPQEADIPPFTLIACPVIFAAPGPARKTTSGAMSAGSTTPSFALASALANNF